MSKKFLLKTRKIFIHLFIDMFHDRKTFLLEAAAAAVETENL